MTQADTDMRPDERPDIEDELAGSEAPLLVHLEELRNRLIVSILAVLVGAGVCFLFAVELYDFLAQPYKNVANEMSVEGAASFNFIYTAPLEVFFAKLRIAFFGGVFVSFPFLAYQIYAFVAPGLYKRERGALWPFLVAAPVLFTAGAAFVYYVIIPLLARFALGQEQFGAGDSVAIQHLPKVSEYLRLVMSLMLAFGFSFQMPIVLTLLGQAGILGSASLRKGRKYAVVIVLVVAAFVTPPDIISQVLLTIPVMLLYEASIWCVALIERRRPPEEPA